MAQQLGGFPNCIVLEWLLPLRYSHTAEDSGELPWYLICCYENSEFECSKNSFFPNSYQNPIVVLLLVDLFAGFTIIIMIFLVLLSRNLFDLYCARNSEREKAAHLRQKFF